MTPSVTTHPPSRPRGLLKWVYDVPRVLYRLRLGWLLGHRFLLLTHRGRKSGRIRRTMLEVVRYDPRTGESVVLSAYGDRSDWYRNILANPPIEVRTGRRRYTPQVRLLGSDEAYDVLADYRRRYGPLLARFLRYMGYTYTGKDDELHAIAAHVHAVGFRPSSPADGTS
jgi:deazaflavin-dependent oxidoreductase (nitroreductase family)